MKALRLLLAGALLFGGAALALPAKVPHYGYAVDDAGDPWEGDHAVRVTLYDAPIGGNPVFTELHPVVPFFVGHFFLDVGGVVGLDAKTFLDDVWLDFEVDGAAIAPRIAYRKVPAALRVQVARDVTGVVDASSLVVGGQLVVDGQGRWVGPLVGLDGPPGPDGPIGVAGPEGPPGEPGPEGEGGQPDTPPQVRDKIRQVDGPGSGIDVDRLDGHALADFPTTPVAMRDRVRDADGAGSGLDGDRLDGHDLDQFPRTPAEVVGRVRLADGTGSGLSFDRFDGFERGDFLQTGGDVRNALWPIDGTGSGIDADRLDGRDITDLLRNDGPVNSPWQLDVAGTLTVEGTATDFEMQVDNRVPGPCDAAMRGRVFYSSAERTYLGCTDEGWVDLAGGQQVAPADLELPEIQGMAYIPFTSLQPGGFEDVPGTAFTFDKAEAGSWIKVNLRTTLGWHMVGHNDACRYRVVVDGNATREYRGHTSNAPGWRMEPHAMSWFVPGVGAGPRTIRLQVAKTGAATNHCYTAWPENDTTGLFYAEEIAADRIGITQHMGDTRHTPNGWEDLPGRTVSYAKKEAGTVLEVVWTDSVGYHQEARGSWGCRWRLVMDGGVQGRPLSSHPNSDHTGWRIHGRESIWRLDNVPVGNHTFKIQLYRPDATRVRECLAGWPNNATGNALAVVERPVGNSAIRRHFPDTRQLSGQLTNREVQHEKRFGRTRVRVRYADNLGYSMVGHSWGCRWYLTVDHRKYGHRYASHTSTARGWRINHHTLEWVVQDLPAGDHVYGIVVERPNAGSVNECLAGWPNADTMNYLLIEEIE